MNQKGDSAEQRAGDRRTEQLKEAWDLGIQGHYHAALEVLNDLLKEKPMDVGALRLKGNLLELKEMDLLENSGKKLMSSNDYRAARRCYERILEVDPDNVKARIDLGDHYRNLGANDKALEYYGAAARVLQQSHSAPTWKEDVEQLLAGVGLLAKHERLAPEASLVEAWCREVLARTAM